MAGPRKLVRRGRDFSGMFAPKRRQVPGSANGSPRGGSPSLRQAEAGTPVEEVCRKMGVAEPSFCRWS